MTVLDDNFILKHVSPENCSNEFTEKCHKIRNKSHIKINKKGITEIGETVLCRNTKVFYLQDNKIQNLKNLKQFSRLTHLYLQNNSITNLEGFQTLSCLIKLYLGSNHICVLENLEHCQLLEELYIGSQRLQPTEKLICDPRTIEGIAEKLVVLDVAGNCMTGIKELDKLTNLEMLDVSGNNLSDINETAESLKKLECLHTFSCDFNPFCSSRNFKGALIMVMPSIRTFNGVNITRGMYTFYKSLHTTKTKRAEAFHNKKMRQMRKSESSSQTSSFDADRFNPDRNVVSMNDIRNIVKELPSGIRAAVNRPEDYSEHIQIINRREFLKK